MLFAWCYRGHYLAVPRTEPVQVAVEKLVDEWYKQHLQWSMTLQRFLELETDILVDVVCEHGNRLDMGCGECARWERGDWEFDNMKER